MTRQFFTIESLEPKCNPHKTAVDLVNIRERESLDCCYNYGKLRNTVIVTGTGSILISAAVFDDMGLSSQFERPTHTLGRAKLYSVAGKIAEDILEVATDTQPYTSLNSARSDRERIIRQRRAVVANWIIDRLN